MELYSSLIVDIYREHGAYHLYTCSSSSAVTVNPTAGRVDRAPQPKLDMLLGWVEEGKYSIAVQFCFQCSARCLEETELLIQQRFHEVFPLRCLLFYRTPRKPFSAPLEGAHCTVANTKTKPRTGNPGIFGSGPIFRNRRITMAVRLSHRNDEKSEMEKNYFADGRTQMVEPTLSERNRFQVYRLNHSATSDV